MANFFLYSMSSFPSKFDFRGPIFDFRGPIFEITQVILNMSLTESSNP